MRRTNADKTSPARLKQKGYLKIGSGLEVDNIIESVGIPIISYHEIDF